MKTSLGIWAFGSMATRFVPAGYKPELANQTTAERVRHAVEGLGDLIDGYEFHYPQELSEENLDEVRAALDGHDVYCLASGLHLDSRFGRGGFVSPDEATRAEALRRTFDAIDFAGELGAHFIIWPGIEGYNYPFQTPYKESWAWFLDGIGQAAVLGLHLRTRFLADHRVEVAHHARIRARTGRGASVLRPGRPRLAALCAGRARHRAADGDQLLGARYHRGL